MKRRSATAMVIPIRERDSCPEPTLDEILGDPIVQAVMRADAVDPDELGAMLRKIADALRVSARP